MLGRTAQGRGSRLDASGAALAATGGEDYELCACVPPERRAAAEAAAEDLTWVGEVVAGPPEVRWRGGSADWRGWEH